jgi:hypothetical protein
MLLVRPGKEQDARDTFRKHSVEVGLMGRLVPFTVFPHQVEKV